MVILYLKEVFCYLSCRRLRRSLDLRVIKKQDLVADESGHVLREDNTKSCQ